MWNSLHKFATNADYYERVCVMVAEDEMSRQESVHKWLDSIAQSRCVHFRSRCVRFRSKCVRHVQSV